MKLGEHEIKSEHIGVPTAGEALALATEKLAAADVPTAAGDAEIIIAHTLGLRRADVQGGEVADTRLTPGQFAQVLSFTERRARREPLQYLTGKALFRQLELAVGPGVFVPRRETEFVTQLAIDALRAAGTEKPIAVDLGTGAGAIALSMATEVAHATVFGVEVAAEAFEWTRRNFEQIAPHNARAVLADMAEALPELNGRVDVVAGNPPFVPDDVQPAAPEVQLFDPGVAVFGGTDGLDLVRALSTAALRLLRPGGALAFEHGISQAPRVAALLEQDGWAAITTHRDPRGQERVTTALREL
ncbi:MAG: [protein release factor]-glutamine N5-methyltransferase [Rhodoglobus sp.]|nr:[protein release factor]-glutamine N5-methyltransferase [Rhodoglobus sp.]